MYEFIFLIYKKNEYRHGFNTHFFNEVISTFSICYKNYFFAQILRFLGAAMQ